MKHDKGRARVPVHNYDDPQQTSIGTHAPQLPPQKGNITGRHAESKRELFAVEAIPIMPHSRADHARPWATITHRKKSEVCITMWITHPLSTPIEEKSAHRSRARASASGSGRAGHGGRDTYENNSQSGKAEPHE